MQRLPSPVRASGPRRLRLLWPLLALALSACATLQDRADLPVARRVAALLPADVVILGEQHDAPAHHAIEREAVEALAREGRLAALVLEMAEEGTGAVLLGATATEAQVRDSLGWNDKAWPWQDYGPAVMAAVRAGVPVIGGNLPRARMKNAMADVSLDAQLGAEAHAAQKAAVRDGHCGLLPEAQIGPMTRIQVARDRALAQTAIKARQPGKTVLLVAGAAHADKTLGVPQHLPTEVSVKAVRLQAGDTPDAARGTAAYDAVWRTPALPQKDYCASLRK